MKKKINVAKENNKPSTLGFVLERVHELERHGFTAECDERKITEEEFNKSLEWIVKNCEISKKYSINSYALKHVIENEIGHYIPNGAAIAAGIALGFECRLEGTGPNAEFKAEYTKEAKNRIKKMIIA
jgi:hypothetical protein